MKNFIVKTLCCMTWALLAGGSAGAGTLDAATAMPHVSSLAAGNALITVKHIFAVGYYNNETFSCGARMEFSDGTAPKISRSRKPPPPSNSLKSGLTKLLGIIR